MERCLEDALLLVIGDVEPKGLWIEENNKMDSPYHIQAREIQKEIVDVLEIGEQEGNRLMDNFLNSCGDRTLEFLRVELDGLWKQTR